MTRDPPEPAEPAEPPDSEVERLFAHALQCEPDARAAFLERACGDAALRREVESLLRADAQAGSFLEGSLAPLHAAGTRIGPYRLIRQIGEGEASRVFLAARDDGQYHQQVAIKLIRPTLDAPWIVQRFHQERQILASLVHPHIARLLDGGTTASGQPYLVMEYIDGEPLDAHCERHALSIARRLELFGTVCQAVHFAHKNLVVHRDLKPGNILVDAGGAPKLVDFGIAKLLDPAWLGLRGEQTATVARLMTPHYASPEQVTGGRISTASDIYSLGVILYRLVTGRRPYEFDAPSLHEIERVVCESVPPPPSHALRATRRNRLPRDLDNIVLMAMRKEPERRYASAQELADDLRRCLERRPVRARPDTLGYRVSALVRRRTGAVASAAAIALALTVGALVATSQWRRAVAAQGRAEAQQRVTQQTLGFVVDLFQAPDPAVPGREPTARELLERGAARLHGDDHPPETRAALLHTLGVVYRNLGDFAKAAQLLEEAVAQRSSAPSNELDLADSLYHLGAVSAVLGQPDRARDLLTRTLAIRERVLGPDDLSVADVLEALADNAGFKIPVPEAQADMRRALDIRRGHAGDELQLTSSMAKLAELYILTARHDEADRLIADAIAIRRTLRGDACQHGGGEFFDSVALARLRQGYFAQAERDLDTAIECEQRVLGPQHGIVIDLMSTRITIWRQRGRYAEAEQLARQMVPVRRALYGDGSPAVDNALHHLALVLYERGQLDEAMAIERQSLAMRQHTYGRAHAAVASSLALIGDIALAGGDASAAEASYREALGIWHDLGEDRAEIATTMRGLAEALLAQDRLAEARSTAERALAWQRARLRPQHPDVAGTLVVLGRIEQIRAPSAAEPLLREALAIRQAALGPDHPYTARAASLLADNLARQRAGGTGLAGRDGHSTE